MNIRKIKNNILNINKNNETINDKLNLIDTQSEDTEEEHIWNYTSDEIKNIKENINTLNDDPEQWNKDNIKESNNNLSEYINIISAKFHEAQKNKDDKDIFN